MKLISTHHCILAKKNAQQSKLIFKLTSQYFVTSLYHHRDDPEELPPQNEIKYLVFRSHLLSLFAACRSCHQLCTSKVNQQIGTYISIKQSCSYCGYEWTWHSQPFIKDRPAGNILLSASILFTGSTPTKVLHLLKCLQVACFTDRTFYYHQSEFLEPAVMSVWKHKQQQLLADCASQDSPLIIGGDGRADSPGHSAKYGSYGIIDLSTNKVLHIELVQVHCIYIHLYMNFVISY